MKYILRVYFWSTISGSTTSGAIEKLVFTACKNRTGRKPQLVFIRTTPQVVESVPVV